MLSMLENGIVIASMVTESDYKPYLCNKNTKSESNPFVNTCNGEVKSSKTT